MELSLEYFIRLHRDRDEFPFRIVMGDETQFHHFTMESLWSKNICPPLYEKSSISAGKVLLTVFSEGKKVSLLNILETHEPTILHQCRAVLSNPVKFDKCESE